jgi:hypothetical protein
MFRRALTLFVLALPALVGGRAFAADIQKLGVSSAIGDVLTVVTHRSETGRGVDPNIHETVEMPDASFDDFAVSVAVETAKRGGGQLVAESFPLGGARGVDVMNWIDGKKFSPPAEVQSRLSASGLSHLLLIVRLRAPAALKLAHMSVGSGYLEGLGFYIDGRLRVRRPDTGEVGTGFLAPYAYFQVLLVNAATGEIERSAAVTASSTFSAARTEDSRTPWDALTPAQKVSAIKRLIRTEVIRVVPELLR